MKVSPIATKTKVSPLLTRFQRKKVTKKVTFSDSGTSTDVLMDDENVEGKMSSVVVTGNVVTANKGFLNVSKPEKALKRKTGKKETIAKKSLATGNVVTSNECSKTVSSPEKVLKRKTGKKETTAKKSLAKVPKKKEDIVVQV